MGFWLPQTIQRRFLLYVLQQISVLSNVDLSNLHVSLGSSSKFSFDDLNLAVEEIKIPHFVLRSGTIKHLEIELTVSGGVSICGEGILFVLKPLVPSETHETSSFSLAKSIHDLTNSLMQYSDSDAQSININNDPESDASNSPLADSNSSIGSNPKENEPVATMGAFENMKNKILNIALSKLGICFENVIFRFLLDDAHIIETTFGKIKLNTEDNTNRKVEIHDFKITHIKKPESNSSENLSDDNMSNSVFYSTKEATSIYMSAMESLKIDTEAEEDLKDENNELSADLFLFNHISVSFQGLSSFDDLTVRDFKVKVQHTSVNIDNILALSESVLSFVLRGFPLNTNEKSPQASALKGYKRFQKEQEILEGFDNLAVDIDQISLYLGDNINVVFKNINYTFWENSEQTLLVDRFLLEGEGISLECSKTPILRATSKANELEINIIHRLLLELNEEALFKIFNFQNRFQEWFTTLNNHFSKYNTTKSRQNAENCLKFHSKPITVSLRLKKFDLYLETCEISGKFPYELFKTKSIKVGRRTKSADDLIFKLEDISIVGSKTRMQLNSFDENLNQSSLTSKLLLRVHRIAVECDFEIIKLMVEDIQSMHSIFKSKSSKTNTDKQKMFLKRSVRILQSSNIIYKQTDQASYAIILDVVDVKVKSIFKKGFGSLQAKISGIMLAASLEGNFLGFCKDITCSRVIYSQQELLASAIKMEDIKKPVLLFQLKTNGKVKAIIQGMSIHYYAKWLEFFSDNNKTADGAPNTNNTQTMHTWELKLIDSTIVLHPCRIRPCLVVIIDHLACNGRASDTQVRVAIKSGTFLLIDDSKNIKPVEKRHYATLISFYAHQGFSGIGKIDSVNILVKKVGTLTSIKVRANNIGLSLCADSAHTLIQVCIDLKIAVSFSDDEKYNFNVPSPIDVLRDVDSNFFCSSHIRKNPECYESDEDSLTHNEDDFLDRARVDEPLLLRENSATDTSSESVNANIRLQESYLDSPYGRDEDSTSESTDAIIIKVEFDVSKSIIKLFDGYDWKFTRKSISHKIAEIGRDLSNTDATNSSNERLELAIFDSIYISAKPSDAVDLKKKVNDEVQGEAAPGVSFKKVDLHPSRHYKALIEVNHLALSFTGYCVNEVTRAESDGSAKVLNRCEISAQNFDIIDNVPTSTWNKLLTLLRHEQWPLERSMLNMEICLIRPVDFLAATELKLDIKIAPLRLHVDQDTLDFLVKFGEFKDDRFELIDEYPDIPFIQKLTTNSVKIKLDYKPKKVDYSGLRSGHTSELMNFFILDGANITLKGVTLYGISGFSELNSILKSVWTPDITSRQLPGVLKGFAPVKSILALGSGARALISVPLAEYKQDQRLGRSLKQGCNVFVRTATGDFVKLGARLASGTQAVLENTEELLGGNGSQGRLYRSEDPIMDINGLLEEDQLVGGSNPRIKGHKPAALVIDASKCDKGEPKIVSLYADQPLDLNGGLEEAYSSLEKHMHLVYDVVWKARGEIKESRSGTAAAAVSVARVAPVAIIRPLIGAAEAIAKALQGISNQLDREQVDDINDKYKSRISKFETQ